MAKSTSAKLMAESPSPRPENEFGVSVDTKDRVSGGKSRPIQLEVGVRRR